MRTQRFTPEFKEEAVRQVIERGYPVSEVASRVGVSTHSLYKWVKAVAPDKTEQRVGELFTLLSFSFGAVRRLALAAQCSLTTLARL